MTGKGPANSNNRQPGENRLCVANSYLSHESGQDHSLVMRNPLVTMPAYPLKGHIRIDEAWTCD